MGDCTCTHARDEHWTLNTSERMDTRCCYPGCSCKEYTPAPSPTDLPDAVVNAAVEAFARKRNPKHSTLDHSETLAIRAALAAASGPWAEQLDAARTNTDEALVEAAKAGCGEIVERLLARNAELQAEVDEWKSEADDQREAFVWANGACQEQATQKWAAIADRDALRAELDNLRDRVNAPLSDDEIDDLGKELDNPNKVYQLDRIAACIESIITTRAALVRGSDDE